MLFNTNIDYLFQLSKCFFKKTNIYYRNTMKLPISFDQFKKNPITAISFILIMVVGYLYVDNKMIHAQQLEGHKYRIEKLESDELRLEEKLDKMNEKLLECLSIGH